MARRNSIALNIAVYVVVLFIVIFSFRYYQEYPILIRVLIADVIGTVLIFISSMVFNNSSMYDPYWSVKPLVIGLYYFLMIPEGEITFIQWFTIGLVALYSLRLTSNFYRGWAGLDHEDWRYRNFRAKFPRTHWIVSFFGIHFFPTIMVYLGCLPLLIIFQEPMVFPGIACLGLFVLLASVALSFFADEQLRSFRKETKNQGKTITHGLWSWSRHPNYLGEILGWWGLFAIALAYGWDFWWTGMGALVITLMFVFISIPMIEKYARSRRQDYADYIEKTAMLIPYRKGQQ